MNKFPLVLVQQAYAFADVGSSLGAALCGIVAVGIMPQHSTSPVQGWPWFFNWPVQRTRIWPAYALEPM